VKNQGQSGQRRNGGQAGDHSQSVTAWLGSGNGSTDQHDGEH
jgi:hypothetical protein